MKLSNLFKKSTKVVSTSKVQKLEKTQLEKVTGGSTSAVNNPAFISKGQAGEMK